jgi:Right handed beta helix region
MAAAAAVVLLGGAFAFGPLQHSPASEECTKSLATGGDLSDFLATLVQGDVGCLRGGTYTDGASVEWRRDASSSNRIMLQSYPGEQAEIIGTELVVAGDYLLVRNLTVRDVVHLDGDGLTASGAGARLEHNTVRHIARNGILLSRTSKEVVVARNFVDDVGWNSSKLPSEAHGIYVQGTGHLVWRNVFTRASGYGIHLYAHPSSVIVAENTAVEARSRGGIETRTDGSNIVVANNIFAGNATYGMNCVACASGCVSRRPTSGHTSADALRPATDILIEADRRT